MKIEEPEEPPINVHIVGADGTPVKIDPVEQSTEQIFLQPSDDLREKVAKLDLVSAKVMYGTYQEQDLVHVLYEALNFGKPWPQLVRIAQYLAAQTIDQLATQEPRAIAQQSYPMGFLEPAQLGAIQTIDDYFRILTLGYPNYQQVLREFLVGRTLGSGNLQQNEPIKLDRLGAQSIADEQNPEHKLFLLRALATDLDELGEGISPGRVEFFNPYLILLGKVPTDRRRNYIQKMLALEYPFTPQNHHDFEGNDNWAAEIMSDIGIR